jgi:hypothetical protein
MTHRFRVETYPWSDESLFWYQLRVRSRSGVTSWSAFTKILGRQSIGQLRPIELVTDPQLLSQLGRLSYVGGEQLSEAAGRITGIKQSLIVSAAHLNLRGIELPMAAWMIEKLQFCPECLGERGYIDYDADFSHIPICTLHRCALLDACPQCDEAISARKPSLFGCGKCGYDLRRSTPTPVSDEIVAFAGALLRFRPIPFEGPLGAMSLSPIEMFRLVEMVAKTEAIQVRHQLDSQWFNHLGWDRRLTALAKLSAQFRDGRLCADDVRHLLLTPFQYLQPFEDRMAHMWKLRELATGEELSGEASRMLRYGQPDVESRFAAYRMGQSLPEAMSDLDAAAIVGVDIQQFLALKQHLYLTEPLEDEGYDGDELLYARDFVETSLGMDALDAVFGINGITQLFYQEGLLRSWSPGNDAPAFGMPDVISFLDRLHAAHMRSGVTKIRQGMPPLVSLPLSKAGQPEKARDQIIAILEGQAHLLSWPWPYRLADIQVDTTSTGDEASNDTRYD